MESNIWIVIIDCFKDIIVAIISLFKKEKSGEDKKFTPKYNDSENQSNNPFITSNSDIEKIDINDPDYLVTISSYLAGDRPLEDIHAHDEGGK